MSKDKTFPSSVLHNLFAPFPGSANFFLTLLQTAASLGFLYRGPGPPKPLTSWLLLWSSALRPFFLEFPSLQLSCPFRDSLKILALSYRHFSGFFHIQRKLPSTCLMSLLSPVSYHPFFIGTPYSSFNQWDPLQSHLPSLQVPNYGLVGLFSSF